MKKLMFLFAIVFFCSCKVTFVPPKSLEAVDLLNNISRDGAIALSDLNFNQVEYDNAANEIGALVALDQTRQKAGKLVNQDLQIQKLFTEYETEHRKKVTIVQSESNTYNKYFQSVVRPRVISENSLK
jgi:ribosomal protein L16 Arg81 hydroxylase